MLNRDHIRAAIGVVNASSGSAMISRPVEAFIVRFCTRIPHVKIPIQKNSPVIFDVRQRFEDNVQNCIDLLDENGSLYIKTARGWKRSEDPDRLAYELSEQNLGILPCHVREAQRRIKHVHDSNGRQHPA